MKDDRRWSALVIAGLLLVIGCGRQDDNVLARVGDTVISKQDLREDMIRIYRSESAAARKSLEERESALDDLVLRTLKVAGARADGYFDTPENQERYNRFLVDGMLNELHKREVLDHLTSEEEARALYDKQGMEVEASYILLRWTADSSDVRRRAQDIARELRKGLDFAEAAERYTEEPNGKERKGELGWFTWGRMVAPFQEAAWELQPGQVSEPVETQFGVHLIKVTGKREVEHRTPFEEQKDALMESVIRMKGDQVSKLGEQYVLNMKEEFGFQLDTAAAADLLADVHAHMKPERQLRDIFAEDLDSGWATRPLAIWENGSITVADLTASLDRNFRQASSLTTTQDMVDMINFAALFPMLERVARAKGLDKDPELVAAAQQQIESGVLMRYEREVIKGKAEVSDDEVAAWYESHPDDYMHPKTVRVQEIYVKDKELAQQLAERAKKGEDFSALARKYTERPGKENTDGTLEPFQSGRYGKMGEAAFALEVGQISDPQPIGRSWSVIKVLEQIPPKAKSLDESKTSIRMKLERQARSENEERWRKETEKKVKVVTYPDRLKTLFAEEQ